MTRKCFLVGPAGLALFLLLFATASGNDVCRWEPPDQVAVSESEQTHASTDRSSYTGMIRVYVCEIVGRYLDSDSIPYDNAFLSFALEAPVDLSGVDSLSWDTIWDGSLEGFPDLDSANAVVMAAVFNSEGYQGQSDPYGDSAFFTVHEIDASVAAYPDGETEYNEVTADFTHSVFIEYGTTTW